MRRIPLLAVVISLGLWNSMTLAGHADTVLYASAYNAYADPVADAILKVDSSGTATPWNLTWTPPATSFDDPEGIAFDSGGNLFVNSGASILKVDSSGVVTDYADKPNAYSSTGLAIDPSNNIYATGADPNNINTPVIYKIDGTTHAMTMFPTLTSGPIFGLVWGPDGQLYGTLEGGDSVVRFDSAGNESIYATLPEFREEGVYNYTNGLAFDSAGNLYVATSGSDDMDAGTIYKITDGGATVTPYVTQGLGLTRGISIDAAGNIYAATQICECIVDPGSNDETQKNYIKIIAAGGTTVTGSISLDDTQRANFLATPMVVPEPSTYALVLGGLGMLLLYRRRLMVD